MVPNKLWEWERWRKFETENSNKCWQTSSNIHPFSSYMCLFCHSCAIRIIWANILIDSNQLFCYLSLQYRRNMLWLVNYNWLILFLYRNRLSKCSQATKMVWDIFLHQNHYSWFMRGNFPASFYMETIFKWYFQKYFR